MTKGRNTGRQLPEPTKLIKSHEVFKAELDDRVQKGKVILGSFNTGSDYERIKSEYKSWDNYNLELLKRSFNDPWNEYHGQYSHAETFRMYNGTAEQRVRNFISTFEKRIEKLEHLRDAVELFRTDSPNAPTTLHENGPTPLDKTQVFIVHGHDEAAKQEVARFIEKLGLTPIILHEQASGGRTIIEKIEEYSNVGFAVVLYTPCDVGALKGKEDKLRGRARQNVVFEHGYLIGKIGRKNVCALVRGEVETPGDITGVVYVSIHAEWKLAIAKELRSSGYQIDMNKVV